MTTGDGRQEQPRADGRAETERGRAAGAAALLAVTLLVIPIVTGNLGALTALRAALGWLALIGIPGFALAVAAGVPGGGGLRLALAPALGSVVAALFHSATCALLADWLPPLLLAPLLPLLAGLWLWRRQPQLRIIPALAALLPASAALALLALLAGSLLVGFGAAGPAGFQFPTCGLRGDFGQVQLRLNLMAQFDTGRRLAFPAFSGLEMLYYHLFPSALQNLLLRCSGTTALTTLQELRPVYYAVVAIPALWALFRRLELSTGAAALGALLVTCGSAGFVFELYMMRAHVLLATGVYATVLTLAAAPGRPSPGALAVAALLLGSLLQIKPVFFVYGGGGLAVVAVVDWLRHRRTALLALGAGALGVGLGVAALQLLRTRIYGTGVDLHLAPLAGLESLFADTLGQPPALLAMLGLGLLLVVGVINLRAVGLLLWACRGRTRSGQLGWWVLATALLSLLGALLLFVPHYPPLALIPFADVGLVCLSVLTVHGLATAWSRWRRWLRPVVALMVLGGALGTGVTIRETIRCALTTPGVVPYDLAEVLGWIRTSTPVDAILLAPCDELGPGLLAERISVAWLPPDADLEGSEAVGLDGLSAEIARREDEIAEFYQTIDVRRAVEILDRHDADLVLTTPDRRLHFPIEGVLQERHAAGDYAVYGIAPPGAGRRSTGDSR